MNIYVKNVPELIFISQNMTHLYCLAGFHFVLNKIIREKKGSEVTLSRGI